MTRNEAMQQLMAAFPGHSICLQAANWHRGSKNHKTTGESIDFEVSLLPGWDGSECTQTRAKTLEKAVKMALDWLPLMPDKDQQEAEADDCFADPINATP